MASEYYISQLETQANFPVFSKSCEMLEREKVEERKEYKCNTE